MKTSAEVVAELDALLAVAGLHRHRVEEALTHIGPRLPMDTSTIEGLPYEDVASLELLLSRFGKLQDLLGAKVFPLLAELTAEPRPAGATFLDLLNRLEKIGALPSAAGWRLLREVRNALAHDYPDDPSLTAAGGNEVVNALPSLFATHDAILAHFRRVRTLA